VENLRAIGIAGVSILVMFAALSSTPPLQQE